MRRGKHKRKEGRTDRRKNRQTDRHDETNRLFFAILRTRLKSNGQVRYKNLSLKKMSHLTSVNKVSGNRNSQLLSTTARIVSSYFEYVSLSAPPIHPSTCLREALHFGLVPSYCYFIFIYWFTVLVYLSPSSLVVTVLCSTHLLSFRLPAMQLAVYHRVALN